MTDKLKIIFMGTAEFAVPSLDILVQSGYKPEAVVTAPDKPAGRGLKLRYSPVKEYALEKGIRVLQPPNLKDLEFLKALKNINPDIQVVVAFRMLPEQVWALPPLGTFNLHASLLPQYRGAAPINHAIINGEAETGVTTFFLDKAIDTGAVIFREHEPILPEDDAGTLYERLKMKGARLVLKTIRSIQSNNYQVSPQISLSENALKSAPKIFKEDCELDFMKSSKEIKNFVRGLAPYPGAWTKINGRVYKILKVKELPERHLSSGTIDSDGKTFVHVGTSDHAIALELLCPEGKRTMSIKEFLMGNKI